MLSPYPLTVGLVYAKRLQTKNSAFCRQIFSSDLFLVSMASSIHCCFYLFCDLTFMTSVVTFSALTLLVGRQEGHPACKKTEWWCAGMVICLERGADLHTAQLVPLPLTVSCSSKIQVGFTFLVLAHLGSPGQRAVKRT